MIGNLGSSAGRHFEVGLDFPFLLVVHSVERVGTKKFVETSVDGADVLFRCDVGPTDRGQVRHQCVCHLGTQLLLEARVVERRVRALHRFVARQAGELARVGALLDGVHAPIVGAACTVPPATGLSG